MTIVSSFEAVLGVAWARAVPAVAAMMQADDITPISRDVVDIVLGVETVGERTPAVVGGPWEEGCALNYRGAEKD